MKVFLQFCKERLPIIPNIILAVGLTWSGLASSRAGFSYLPFIFSTFAVLVFVSELRFMDELKDYDKDVIAHPERPLPRGLITKAGMAKYIFYTGLILVLLCVASYFIFNPVSCVLLTITVVWLYLMYKEFFVGSSLSNYPLVYAITHQIVIVPACMYIVSLTAPDQILSSKSLGFCLMILGTFFSFEVGRKLDPNSSPVLKTYYYMYGRNKVTFMICALLSLTVIGANMLGILFFILPPLILTLLTLPKIFSAPEQFKKVEGMITLNLLYNVWVIVIAYSFGKIS